MKNCSKCGNTVSDQAKFCNKCGNKFEEENMVNQTVTPNVVVNEPVNNTPVNNIQTSNAQVNNASTNNNNKNNPLALAGFIVSLVSFLCCGAGAIIGLVLSIMGLNQIKKTNEKGKGLAIAGIVLSSIGFVVAIIVGIISGISRVNSSSIYYTIMLRNIF